MSRDKQAKIIAELLIKVQDKMVEFDMKEFETQNELYNVKITLDFIG